MVRGMASSVPTVAERSFGYDSEDIVPYERWLALRDELRARFAAGRPTRHLVLDDFLTPDAARKASEFPPSGDGWIHYLHYNEHTFGMNDRRYLPARVLAVIDELSSPVFLSFLREITGLTLLADPSLEGGGLHQSESGGYLNLHTDFTVHPHRPTWRRSLNLLIYLNPEWNDSWGGALELWDPDVKRCVQRIEPRFNRAVLFHTHEGSYHGYPDPLSCPPGATRKALALYYFSQETVPARAVATRYRPRPGDGLRHRILISLDAMLLRAYHNAKHTFGFDDTIANRILRALSRRD